MLACVVPRFCNVQGDLEGNPGNRTRTSPHDQVVSSKYPTPKPNCISLAYSSDSAHTLYPRPRLLIGRRRP